ncbi:MAG: hypothetical protein CMN84_07490 [Spongiibacteraceae bacterium]|jgi:hypothetical protein|nr:hypothetical protein [Spongiibacteraceae bacterium]
MKTLMTCVLLLTTGNALAHSGHGSWASFGHDYEHALFALAAAGVGTALFLLSANRHRAKAGRSAQHGKR